MALRCSTTPSPDRCRDEDRAIALGSVATHVVFGDVCLPASDTSAIVSSFQKSIAAKIVSVDSAFRLDAKESPTTDA